ncbi:hypothetical protein [Anabaena azotica]|uniref:Uncharacterized protein n=1 Tax=Anabaena azotica FACHB-119 TaxID=947527 RepID=A0ABR8D8F0_9NOST|nr:hypothetical protein [Anabaena azotica]MBD2503470.1 hypothetical protein [Anabaena azotica FACHB-119]
MSKLWQLIHNYRCIITIIIIKGLGAVCLKDTSERRSPPLERSPTHLYLK